MSRLHLRVGSFSCFRELTISFVNLCLRLRSHCRSFKQLPPARAVYLPAGEMTSETVPLNPALNGFNIPYAGDEPDYSEHIVRCAWFRGMDGQHSEGEILKGRPAIRRDIPGAHSIELSYPSVLAGQVSLNFMMDHESSYAMTAFQPWEYSLVKIAVGCVTDRLFLNYSRQYQDFSRQQKQQEKGSLSYRLSKFHSQILRHSHVADLDSSLHLSLHQAAAFTEPKLGLRPFFDVDAASYLAGLTCNDKARLVFVISPKKMIPSGIEL